MYCPIFFGRVLAAFCFTCSCSIHQFIVVLSIVLYAACNIPSLPKENSTSSQNFHYKASLKEIFHYSDMVIVAPNTVSQVKYQQSVRFVSENVRGRESQHIFFHVRWEMRWSEWQKERVNGRAFMETYFHTTCKTNALPTYFSGLFSI